jgi:Ca2+-binding EF-hand superfamily protein
MSNGISAVGGGWSAAVQGASAGSRGRKMDVSTMVEQAFSKIDSTGQGYIDKAGIENALGQVSGSGGTDASSSADAIMKALDGNGDGKVTKEEMSTGLQKLADQLDSQFNSMRARGGHGGHGDAPRPPADSAGLSKDEITARAEKLASTNSKAAADLTSLASSFDQADTDGNGKVSFQESQAFRQSQESSGTAPSAGETHRHHAHGGNGDVMGQIMRLMASYGASDTGQQARTVAVTA